MQLVMHSGRVLCLQWNYSHKQIHLCAHSNDHHQRLSHQIAWIKCSNPHL